jgi:lipid II:glycine glycyltransferase (peptidoglycan interpeptide bridge formation enzyme)
VNDSRECGSVQVLDCEPCEWNAYLAKTPGGSYAQTSLWALAKLASGYWTRRFTLKNGHGIEGGAQLLIRHLPLMGAVGYVPLGPVLNEDRADFADIVVAHLKSLVSELGIIYLAVQPPAHHQAFASRLRSRGFIPCFVNLAPTASVVIDLSKDLDELLAKMRRTTRYNVRYGQRKGVRVREGTEQDLGTFHKLLLATAQRQGNFKTLDWEYLQELWRLFAPGGHLKMFLAEFEGQVLSAGLLMNYGDTAIYWKGCWSGEHSGKHPNEALQWAAIQWAKAQGYRYDDFGGIPRPLAESVLRGDPIDEPGSNSVASYKLGFGGQAVLFPEPLAYVPNPAVRRVVTSVPTQKLQPLKRLVNCFK